MNPGFVRSEVLHNLRSPPPQKCKLEISCRILGRSVQVRALKLKLTSFIENLFLPSIVLVPYSHPFNSKTLDTTCLYSFSYLFNLFLSTHSSPLVLKQSPLLPSKQEYAKTRNKQKTPSQIIQIEKHNLPFKSTFPLIFSYFFLSLHCLISSMCGLNLLFLFSQSIVRWLKLFSQKK